MVAFFVGSAVGVEPAWIALGRGRGRRRRGGRPGAAPARLGLLAAAAPLFLLFVLALAVVVDAAVTHGLGDAARDVLPAGDGLLALLAMAGLAAVLANLVNNVPATLVLSSVVPAGNTGPAPGHAPRGQHRPQPHLHRLAGHTAVAAGRPGRRGRAEPAGVLPFRGRSPPRAALVLATVMLRLTLQVTG